MDKQNVIHPYHGLLLSHKKNKVMIYAWMNLENTMPSEGSQSQKAT